jgi:hypothetical protein
MCRNLIGDEQISQQAVHHDAYTFRHMVHPTQKEGSGIVYGHVSMRSAVIA